MVWSMGLVSLRAAEFVCVLCGLVLRSPLERRGVFLKREYSLNALFKYRGLNSVCADVLLCLYPGSKDRLYSSCYTTPFLHSTC